MSEWTAGKLEIGKPAATGRDCPMQHVMRILCLGAAMVAMAATAGIAQVDTLWTRTYGGAANDGARSIVATSDGGFVTVGYTYSAGEGSSDVYLVKTDALGEPSWTRTYGGVGRDYGYGVCETGDGGYVFTGYTTSGGAGYTDLYLVKVDAVGDEIWSRTYGGAAADEGRAVCETGDGHLIVTGCTESFGAGEQDIYLLKTDAHGDTLWSRSWGGAESDWGSAVCEMTGGAYGVVGTTGSTSTNRDIYALKVGPDGTTWWTGSYGSTGGIDADWGHGVVATDDGGMVFTGYGNDHVAYDANDAWLIRVDTAGNAQWERRYGEPGNYYDYGTGVCRTLDGGYLVCGATKTPSTQRNELYLIKTDAQGVQTWRYKLGGVGAEWGYGLVEVAAGRYVVAGHTDSYGAGKFDAWMVSVFDPTVAIAEAEVPGRATFMSAPMPNPGRSAIWFSLHVPRQGALQLSVVDAQGRMVRALHTGAVAAGTHDFIWDLRNEKGAEMAAGVYFIVSEGVVRSVRKAVVVR